MKMLMLHNKFWQGSLFNFRSGTVQQHSLLRGGGQSALSFQEYSWRLLVGCGHNDYSGLRRHDVRIFIYWHQATPRLHLLEYSKWQNIPEYSYQISPQPGFFHSVEIQFHWLLAPQSHYIFDLLQEETDVEMMSLITVHTVQACRCLGENSGVPVCHCRGAHDRSPSAGHCFQLQLLLPPRNRPRGDAVSKF